MQILGLLIIGAAAGFIAIGVLGALAGGLVLRALLSVLGFAAGFVGAVLGALVLIWLWETYGPKGGR